MGLGVESMGIQSQSGESVDPFNRLRGAQRRTRDDETFEQQQARDEYNSWKRTIKDPPRSYNEVSIQEVWTGALAILNGDEREWKQKIPCDLDDDNYYGRLHVQAVVTARTRSDNHNRFIQMVQPFLLVVTHSSLLDCLSVDTFVGGLYNFISGTNGTRAMPFFQHLCETLVNAHVNAYNTSLTSTYESTLSAMLTTIHELLKREARARFNDDLPILIDSMDNATQIIFGERQSQILVTVQRKIGDIRALFARAKGLLAEDMEEQHIPFLGNVSTYPLGFVMPGNRHDNDKADITDVKLFPTSDEILSNETDFLPSMDPDQPHFLTDLAERHIDTQFRLLRHDIFGELKDALGSFMHAVKNNPSCLDSPKIGLGDIRARHYPNAYIKYISSEDRRGLEVHMSFMQPHSIRQKSASETRKWWDESKSLSEGVLLSFIVAQNDEVQHLFFIVTGRNSDTTKDHGLAKDGRQGTITVKLVSHHQCDVEMVIRLSCQKARGRLIEFPSVLPATFLPILENLQRMQGLSRLPFRQWLFPTRVVGNENVQEADVPPPLYSRTPGFKFSLEPILRPDSSLQGSTFISPSSLVNDPVNIVNMETQTYLDPGQCKALLAALTREFAFIQGPPGTGKSYLGIQLLRILMECKQRASLGPVIIVCYTNHALDQFLESIYAQGIKKIIRIGGQSQSSLMQELNLRKVSQTPMKTSWERYRLRMSYAALENEADGIKKALGRVHGVAKQLTWSNVQYFLSKKYPSICDQFRLIDDDSFEVVGRHPFDLWLPDSQSILKSADLSTLPASEIVDAIGKAEGTGVNSLSTNERCVLVKMWAKEIHENAMEDVFQRLLSTNATQERLTNIYDGVDLRVLEDADVIGITTTGLAKRISVLEHTRSKVVICEEAGEVMEPHMISALLPHVEHLIQIGDHEQLRPQINNYALSLESRQGALYQLDRSQFERLSAKQPGRLQMPIAQLSIQRRMRPEISRLIRDTIYPKLEDHSTTINLPGVVGMRNNVYWLEHKHFEEAKHSEMHHKSHINIWEVEMVRALVQHIVRQGAYQSSEIAVLTPYTGQLQKLRSVMRKDFEIVLSERDQDALKKDGFNIDSLIAMDEESHDVTNRKKAALQKKTLSDLLRLATVDNFQGEEAKVIIVSLVRSNKEKRVGFLRTTNRINVLLSRAQHGMYLIGNTETYANIGMWQKVIEMLRASDCVGDSLSLCCPRHTDTVIRASEPEDFSRLSPEGGCREACAWRLPDCGHMCQARCHSQSMHDAFSCVQPCKRLHEPCKHACQKQTCGEDCGECRIKLNGVLLECGHTEDNVMCYVAQKPEGISCHTLVPRRVPRCNHVVEVACSLDLTSDYYQCPKACTTILACGHGCTGTCGKCDNFTSADLPRVSHQQCEKICGRRFATCNHICRRKCHDGKDCGPCLSPCEIRCQHSRCHLLCHEPCAPCIEMCTWSCEHQGSCTLPCSAPCDRLPCDQRCLKLLPCGHQCPGLCGESCPKMYCQDCGMKPDERVDLLEMKTYSEIDVNETPIVVLGCGHFFTAETLDGLIGMHDVYTTGNNGRFTALEDFSGSLAAKIPQCPDCQSPVRQYVTQRYNRVINRAVLDEMSKRFLVSGESRLNKLKGRMELLKSKLEDSSSNFSQKYNGDLDDIFADGNKLVRYEQAYKLIGDIDKFLRDVVDRNQPAQKLHEAISQALMTSKTKSIQESISSFSLDDQVRPVPPVHFDRRIMLGGRMIKTKAECIVLEDMLRVASVPTFAARKEFINVPSGGFESLTDTILRACVTLIKDCSSHNLPRLAVEASLDFSRVVQLYQSSTLVQIIGPEKTAGDRHKAKELLERALELCKQPFQNVEEFKKAVQESIKLLSREWYEPVTSEELATIKQAMVLGSQGIATHSGHWYNCANGHPFAIGECGMPMEEARCPECGTGIGGSNHQAVEGVTRAMNMEG